MCHISTERKQDWLILPKPLVGNNLRSWFLTFYLLSINVQYKSRLFTEKHNSQNRYFTLWVTKIKKCLFILYFKYIKFKLTSEYSIIIWVITYWICIEISYYVNTHEYVHNKNRLLTALRFWNAVFHSFIFKS